MISTLHVPEDVEKHLTSESLRQELHRFRISLVNQLRDELLQSKPSNDWLGSRVSAEDCTPEKPTWTSLVPLAPSTLEAPVCFVDHSEKPGNRNPAADDHPLPGSTENFMNDPNPVPPDHTSSLHRVLTGKRNSVQMRRKSVLRRFDDPSLKWQSWYKSYLTDKTHTLSLLGEGGVFLAIVLSAILFGCLTEYNAQNGTEKVPGWSIASEVIFCIVFTIELIVRIAKHGSQFFVMKGYGWNCFDTSLVCISWADMLMEIYVNIRVKEASTLKKIGFLQGLRMLRLLRILRVARLLKFMNAFLGDLNVVFAAIGGSLKYQVSTILILMGLLYVAAVAFTQVSTTHLASLADDDTDDHPLRRWWGSLGRSILSLFESIFGGVDWDDVVDPLMRINKLYGLIFAAFIAFMVLAILNVVTGSFVEATILNAKRMKEKSFKQHVRQIFKKCDIDDSGHVTKDELELCLYLDSVATYISELGIDIQDVDMLFEYLDDDQSNSIDPEELLTGLVRLRSGTKFIDIMTILYELDNLKTLFMGELGDIRKETKAILDKLQASSRGMPAGYCGWASPCQVKSAVVEDNLA